jgi:hypothetical protein
MLRARRSLQLGSLVAMALTLAVFELGCFKPSIKDGGFLCATTGVKCPEGFSCNPANNRCWLYASDGGPVERPDGPTTDVGPDVPPDVPPTCTTFDAFVPPDGGCTPQDGGLCDPVCQTGCTPGCRVKCSVPEVPQLTLTCNPALLNSLNRFRREGEFCDRVSMGAASQTDDCGPGLVCMTDFCASPRCYKFCRSNSDCPNSFCEKDGPGGTMVCDIPFNDACTPTAPVSGCGTQSCYVSSTHPTHTICDCTGSVPEGYQCDRSRDCFPGLLCVRPAGAGFECRRVCRLDGTGAQCPGGPTACAQYRGANPSNQPHQIFGFCN